MRSDPRDASRCQICGADLAEITYDGTTLCDRCFDVRIAADTGMPRLPEPPPPATYPGPDGTPHRFRFQLRRMGSGIVAEAVEQGVPPGDGYHITVHGSHHTDTGVLLTRLILKLHARLSHAQLEPGPYGQPMITGDAIIGRLEWNEAGGPADVIVDGVRLSWEEFGEALQPFEGWEFELRFRDSEIVDDDLDPSPMH